MLDSTIVSLIHVSVLAPIFLTWIAAKMCTVLY